MRWPVTNKGISIESRRGEPIILVHEALGLGSARATAWRGCEYHESAVAGGFTSVSWIHDNAVVLGEWR